MLKVLIVDDEVFVRGGLRTMINWTDYGFEVVGDAVDGEKALNLALETKPDLVLTDLVMPHMNGLELIRELNSKLPETKVIVLSCHNDYEFVREAMQMKNVLDYLFKLTMQPQDIEAVLVTVKQAITEEQNKKRNVYAMQALLQKNKMLEYGRFINSQLGKGIIPKVGRIKSELNFSLPCAPYVVIVFIADYKNSFSVNEEELMVKVLAETARELNINLDIGSVSDGEYGLVLSGSDFNDNEKTRYWVECVVRQLETAGVVVHIGIAPVASAEGSFRDAYIQAHAQAEATAKPKAGPSGEIDRAIDYLHRNYQENIKLSTLAEYVHLNESYLSSMIKKTTGLSFTEILNQIRIDEAKKLLINTNLSVEKIADTTGFSSWSYFSRVFKKCCGITPAEYRRKGTKNSSIQSKDF